MDDLPPPPPVAPKAPFERLWSGFRAWPAAAQATTIGVVVVVITVAITQFSSDRPPPPPTPPLPPEGLEAETKPFGVDLTWRASTDPDVDGYRVYRDETALGTTPNPHFTDDDLLPGQSYVYGVQAYTSAGTESLVIEIPVTIRTAPTSEARVDGLFSVRFQEQSDSGFRKFRPDTGAEWEFEPRCPKGPCDVTWRYPLYHLRAKLGHANASYKGKDHGRVGVGCGRSAATTYVDVQGRVSKAGVIDGEWRATEFQGRYRERTPDQLGCSGTLVRYSFTASLLPEEAAGVFLVRNDACRAEATGFIPEGTGFIAGRGLIVTNAHVVAGDATPAVVVFDRVIGAKVVVFEPSADIAILRVRGVSGPTLELASSAVPRGERATALGFPDPFLTGVSAKVVALLQYGFDLHDHRVALDGYGLRAKVRHGNSGGPLLLDDGRVAGVVTRGSVENRGYAVVSTEVIPLLELALDRNRGAAPGPCLDE